MKIVSLLLKEMEHESVITEKFLALVPAEKFDWKPHEKSMSLQQLAVHIAELPSWVVMALSTDGIDFATMDYKPTPVSNNDELRQLFHTSLEKGKEALSKADEKDLEPEWVMRMGDKILNRMTKYEVIRHAFAQTTHHRAQLGVYLRLLNIPIPGSYGPSADDTNF